MILKQKKAELMKKSQIDTSSLSTGILNRVQANRFIDLTVEYQRELQDITTRAIDYPKGQVDKITNASPVLRLQDSEGGTETTTHGPTVTTVNYDIKQLVACYDLTIQADDDSIEKNAFRSSVVRMFSATISNNLAQLVVEGDTSLGNATDTQKLLRSWDGIHVRTQLCPNILDVNGLGVSLLMFKDLMAKLPKKWKTGNWKTRFKWLVSTNVFEDMQYAFTNRSAAVGVSTAGWQGDVSLAPFGIQMVVWPFIPEDLTIGTAATDGTFALLVDPKESFVMFIQRNIQFFFDFRPRKGKTETTIYMGADFIIIELDQMAKARGLSIDASSAYAG